jgi:hypothetical protein
MVRGADLEEGPVVRPGLFFEEHISLFEVLGQV